MPLSFGIIKIKTSTMLRRVRLVRTAAIQENFLEEATTQRSGGKSKEVFRNFKIFVCLVGSC